MFFIGQFFFFSGQHAYATRSKEIEDEGITIRT